MHTVNDKQGEFLLYSADLVLHWKLIFSSSEIRQKKRDTLLEINTQFWVWMWGRMWRQTEDAAPRTRNTENAEAPGFFFMVAHEFWRTVKVTVVKTRQACNELGSASTPVLRGTVS